MIISVAPLLKQPVGERLEFEFSEESIDPRGETADLLSAGISSIDASIVATHTNPGPYLEGTVSGRVEGQCGRCLAPAEVLVEASFAEQYYVTIGLMSGVSAEELPEDVKTVGSDFRIDLTPLLREELLLAVPPVVVCRADCRGLCPGCGEDLNLNPHEHEQTGLDRWARLRELRDLPPDNE